MLLRRLAENLQNHNWSIVLTELLIVVVGVFMGLQVSNWNDSRLDDKRAGAYLERIRADLDADLVASRNRMDFWSEVEDYGSQALHFANTGEAGDLSEWDLVLAYFQSSQVAEFYTTRTTYDELKSGGELVLIDDLELRNSLALYYTYADNAALTERPAYREHVRGIIPIGVQSYIWNNCYGTNPNGDQMLLDCVTPMTATTAAQLAAEIGSNKPLMAELRYWMSTMRVATLIGEYRTVLAEQIRDAVDVKIDARSGGDER